MKTCALLAGGLLFSACADASQYGLVENLKYRASWGDLGQLTPAPLERPRSLRIEKGSDELLRQCLDHPEKWHKDPLMFRFGHLHAFSTLGCRERTSPSMHAVFYKMPDGTRQAWIHFDLYSPNNLAGHAKEVLQNRLTFGRTSQVDVYRGLIERRDDTNVTVPAPHYDLNAHARQYAVSTFGPASLASSIASGGFRAMFDESTNWGRGFDDYRNHIAGSIARHTIQQTIEFAAGALVQQDEAFVSSGQEGMGRRARSALYHSFFVPGRNGDELAFPRIAAAVGTAWILSDWHPWTHQRISPWTQTSIILSSYVLRSFWHEFKPDLKSRLLHASNKLRSRTP